jgi:hypothetical protein
MAGTVVEPRDVWPNRIYTVGGVRFRFYESGAVARIGKPRFPNATPAERFLRMSDARRLQSALRKSVAREAA